MNEIINVQTNEQNEQRVSARELHKVLEVKTRFSLWFKSNSKMFLNNVDFTGVVTTTPVNNGGVQRLDDYSMTLDMAKHVAMISGTEKGSEIRTYFIRVEEAYNTPDMMMARAIKYANTQLIDYKEKVKFLETSNAEMKPKADYFDDLVDRNLLTSFRDTAKELGIGQKKFIDWLIENKYVYRDKGRKRVLKHYAKYDRDLFEFRESVSEWTDKSFIQTLITPKGRATFKLLIENVA